MVELRADAPSFTPGGTNAFTSHTVQKKRRGRGKPRGQDTKQASRSDESAGKSKHKSRKQRNRARAPARRKRNGNKSKLVGRQQGVENDAEANVVNSSPWQSAALTIRILSEAATEHGVEQLKEEETPAYAKLTLLNPNPKLPAAAAQPASASYFDARLPNSPKEDIKCEINSMEHRRARLWRMMNVYESSIVREHDLEQLSESEESTVSIVPPVVNDLPLVRDNEAVVTSKYDTSARPIFDAISSNDCEGLQFLMERCTLSQADGVSPLQFATNLNYHLMVRTLLSWKGGEYHVDQAGSPPALFIAATQGYGECLSILLASGIFASLRDDEGNNVLHICCSSSTPLSSLEAVLKLGSSQVSKLMHSTNDAKETPLHVACRCGRADVVDTFLAPPVCNFSTLFKVLECRDSQGQTPLLSAIASGNEDVVMSLLMWKGHNRKTGQSSSLMPCALMWATSCDNLDMVQLLLEFSDPSGRGYDVTGALRHLVLCRKHKSARSETSLQILEALVYATANPMVIQTEQPVLSLAAQHADVEAVRLLLLSHSVNLRRVQQSRRRDPLLALQPETYFAGIEAREAAEQTLALRHATATGLGIIKQTDSEASLAVMGCVDLLYEHGSSLTVGDMNSIRLNESPSNKDTVDHNLIVEAVFAHWYEPSSATRTPGSLGFWSHEMLAQNWCDQKTDCRFCVSKSSTRRPLSQIPTDVVIKSSGGACFSAHSDIVAKKSEKLACAIQFNRSKSEEAITLCVMLAESELFLMLHHIYHGSLPTDLPEKDEELIDLLLDLLVLGDEYVCPSLMQECEMRLTSTAKCARSCVCWHCCAAVSTTAERTTCMYRYSRAPNCASLLSSTKSLDALAVIQTLNVSGNDDLDVGNHDYEIRVQLPVENRATSLKSLELLRNTAVMLIMRSFGTVCRSRNFAVGLAKIESNLAAKHGLMSYCLDILHDLPHVFFHIV